MTLALERKKNQRAYKELTKHKFQPRELAIPDDNNGMEFEQEEQEVQGNNLKNVKNTSQNIDFILENSDILLEVLDARDPLGCRCRNLEKRFIERNPENKIILILNKIDLVPTDVAVKWKSILSNEFPTVLFKSNLQKQDKNLGSTQIYSKSFVDRQELSDKLINSSKAMGTTKLLELIKNYSKVDRKCTSVTVGIIGFPNVGKSSLINSMMKKRAVGVSSNPGFTKHVQRIELDK